jgi:hypothetical protein
MPIASAHASFRAATPQTTSTAARAIPNWRGSCFPDAVKVARSNATSGIDDESRPRRRVGSSPAGALPPLPTPSWVEAKSYGRRSATELGARGLADELHMK